MLCPFALRVLIVNGVIHLGIALVSAVLVSIVVVALLFFVLAERNLNALRLVFVLLFL